MQFNGRNIQIRSFLFRPPSQSCFFFVSSLRVRQQQQSPGVFIIIWFKIWLSSFALFFHSRWTITKKNRIIKRSLFAFGFFPYSKGRRGKRSEIGTLARGFHEAKAKNQNACLTFNKAFHIKYAITDSAEPNEMCFFLQLAHKPATEQSHQISFSQPPSTSKGFCSQRADMTV